VTFNKFKIIITCHPEYAGEPLYQVSDPLYISKDKEFTEELCKYLIDYSRKSYPEKCLNTEYLSIDNLVEDITGEYTVFALYK
jgi:hypothetical protein